MYELFCYLPILAAKYTRAYTHIHTCIHAQEHLRNWQAAAKAWGDSLLLKRQMGDMMSIRMCLARLCKSYEALEDYMRVVEFGTQLRETAYALRDPEVEAKSWLHIAKGNAVWHQSACVCSLIMCATKSGAMHMHACICAMQHACTHIRLFG